MQNKISNIMKIPNYNSQGIINTNNIKEVEDNDSSKLENKNNYYDINKNIPNNKSQIQTELSTITDSSNLNEEQEETLDKEEDINQENNLDLPIIKDEEKKFSGSLLYGNSINDINPKRLGRLYAFFYINKKPLIIIGPDCKNYHYIINISYFFYF